MVFLNGGVRRGIFWEIGIFVIASSYSRNKSSQWPHILLEYCACWSKSPSLFKVSQYCSELYNRLHPLFVIQYTISYNHISYCNQLEFNIAYNPQNILHDPTSFFSFLSSPVSSSSPHYPPCSQSKYNAHISHILYHDQQPSISSSDIVSQMKSNIINPIFSNNNQGRRLPAFASFNKYILGEIYCSHSGGLVKLFSWNEGRGLGIQGYSQSNKSYYIFAYMPQRKAWTAEEDKVLKTLRDEQKISKWSSIAKKMHEQYQMPLRTGKQCRERYHNHLDSTILRVEWTDQEEQFMYRLHDQIGNKWAIIAQKLPGRTDNCVKNHFYSKMRKAIRKLNKIIHLHFRKEVKEIKLNVLYKLVEATDEKFKVNPLIDEEISDRCCELKNLLLEFANEDDDEEPEDINKLYELAVGIHQVSSRYRKRPKRSRRSSAHGPELIPIGKFSPSYRSANSDHEIDSQQEDDSENQSELLSRKNGSKLESVKEEDEVRWAPHAYQENKNLALRFIEEKPENIDHYLMEEEAPSQPHYFVEQENNAENDNENMLSQQIQKMNLQCDYNLRQVEVDDFDLMI